MNILSIKKRPSTTLHYDLSVEKNENFYANGILTHNCSLPARNVVVIGTTRGMNDVDELDIIQMGGRAGRKGLDPCGDVHFIMDSQHKWEKIIANPRKVISTLLRKEVLGFHILAEIKNGVIFNQETLLLWFDNTLAKLQMPIDDELLKETLDQLYDWKMMKIDDRGFFKLKALGRVSATLYLFPADVYHWACAFNAINEVNTWDSDLALSWAIGGMPTQQLDYVPRNEEPEVRGYTEQVRQVVDPKYQYKVRQSMIAYKTYDLLTGNGGGMYVRNIQNDIERLTQAFKWLEKLYQWDQYAIFETLPLRVKYGIGTELVELCKLPRIGGARAKKLYNRGIQSIEDVLMKPKQVQQIMGENAMPAIMKTARELKRQPATESFETPVT